MRAINRVVIGLSDDLFNVRVLSKQMVIYECCMQGVTESFKIRIFSF